MVRKTTITNENQKFILSQLRTRKVARFSDIKPLNINSNSFSYHLKELLQGGWITKSSEGYSLGPTGLAHAARDTEVQAVRMQPNIAITLLIQDSEGNVLVRKKPEQPFIGEWELPTVLASVADTTTAEAGAWAARKLLHVTPYDLRHVGDCYVRVHKGKIALSATLQHIIRFSIDGIDLDSNEYGWFQPLDIARLPHVPALDKIIARAFFNDDFFFEEYTAQYKEQERQPL